MTCELVNMTIVTHIRLWTWEVKEFDETKVIARNDRVSGTWNVSTVDVCRRVDTWPDANDVTSQHADKQSHTQYYM